MITAADLSRLLEERAARLAARVPQQAEARGDDVIVCEVQSDLYGFDVKAIARVMPMLQTTAVPQASNAVIGIFGRDGRVFSAVDLAGALGSFRGDTRNGHLLVMRHPQQRIAFRVDRALALMNVLADEDPSAPPPVALNLVRHYAYPSQSVQGEHRRIAILDAERLLSQFSHLSRPSGV